MPVKPSPVLWPKRNDEFVAVLGNQPQGGFITRKPTRPMETDDMVASGDGDGFGFFSQRSWNPQSGTQYGYPQYGNPQAPTQYGSPYYGNPQSANPRRRGGQYYWQSQQDW